MRMIEENMAKQLEWCSEAPFYTLGPLTLHKWSWAYGPPTRMKIAGFRLYQESITYGLFS